MKDKKIYISIFLICAVLILGVLLFRNLGKQGVISKEDVLPLEKRVYLDELKIMVDGKVIDLSEHKVQNKDYDYELQIDKKDEIDFIFPWSIWMWAPINGDLQLKKEVYTPKEYQKFLDLRTDKRLIDDANYDNIKYKINGRADSYIDFIHTQYFDENSSIDGMNRDDYEVLRVILK